MLASGPAAGQGKACFARDEVVENLAKKYQETIVAQGVVDQHHLMELFRSRGGETWTLVISKSNGISCLVAVGEGWHSITSKPLPEGTAL